MEQVKKAAIVLAAGHGKRMHSKVAKQYLLLNGEPVLVHALRAFEMSGMDTIILVTGADEVEFCRKDIVEAYGFSSVKQVVPGGKERYDSVWNGLCALKAAGFMMGRDRLWTGRSLRAQWMAPAVILPAWQRCR